MTYHVPERGFMFWPVGNGDSTTILVTKGVVVQVDLNHLTKSDNSLEPEHPIVDRLIELLPVVNGKPYLAVLVITHPDEDHCKGFKALLDSDALIGEIWFTPRLFREDELKLCDEACALRDEVQRRVDIAIKSPDDVASGDRVRLVGHDPDFVSDDHYKRFPYRMRIHPGSRITRLDGVDYADIFAAFIHAPFKEDCDGDRNNTSVAMQVCLTEGDKTCKALLFGDLCLPTIQWIFEKTHEKKNEQYLEWDILLAPHHCSKYVMFWKDSDGNLHLSKEIMEEFEKASRSGCYVVASSKPIPPGNGTGDNPPHVRAKNQYLTIVKSGHFIVTHEHPDEEQPQPVVFELSKTGTTYLQPEVKVHAATVAESVSIASVAARVNPRPSTPQTRLGYGEGHE